MKKLPLKTYTDKSPETVMFLLGASITTLLKAGEREEAEAVYAAAKVFAGFVEDMKLKRGADDTPERFEEFMARMSRHIEVEPQSDNDTSFNAGPEDPDDAPKPPKLNGRRGH
jgi:hypothetical protein